MITIDQIKQLREETGLSVLECKKALEKSGGDIMSAKSLLREWGREVAEKKQAREAGEGMIECYVHTTGKVGVLVHMRCETDFVAKSNEFRNLAHDLALQVASMDPENVLSLLEQQYIKDSSKTIKNLIEEYIAKLGENIVVERFVRFQI